MNILFTCKKCGFEGLSLEGHPCAARKPPVPKPAPVAPIGRLEQAKAVLSAVEGRLDRNAYHKAYMKTYMRGWRARRKAGPT